AVLGHLPEDVVRGEPQRIVDVEDARVRGAQALGVDGAHARIDRRRVETRDLEDLRGAVDAGAARGNVADASRGLDLDAPPAQALAIWVEVEDLARAEVQPVLA